ncbi:MAG: class I SAM-dependent methyltransferase [bacterium]
MNTFADFDEDSKKFLNSINYALLTDNEKGFLARKTIELPKGGVIVEIGTCRGGSLAIFHHFSRGNDVKIFSIDIQPCLAVHQKFADISNVTLIHADSVDVARNWKKQGLLIDLLFIDGRHCLENIFYDYNEWIKYVKPGGQIIFHDYDFQEGGGLTHLPVKIFVDTILRLDLLEDVQQLDLILYGTLKDPYRKVSFSETLDTFSTIMQQAVEVKDVYTDYLFEWFTSEQFLLKINNRKPLIKADSPEIASYFARGLKLTKLIFCYILDDWLKKRYAHKVLTDIWGKAEWAEAMLHLDYLQKIKHSYDDLMVLNQIKDEFELSRFISTEQVRIAMCWQLAHTLFIRMVERVFNKDNFTYLGMRQYLQQNGITKKVIIFGASATGALYSSDLLEQGYDIVGFIDNYLYTKDTFAGFPVYKPDVISLNKIGFDYVVLATTNPKYKFDMYVQLFFWGYPGFVFG